MGILRLDSPMRVDRMGAAERDVLGTIQAGILKGHGRDFAKHVFLQFAPDCQPAAAAAFLSNLPVTSAWQQMVDTWAYSGSRGIYEGTTIVTAALTAAGMEFLALPLPLSEKSGRVSAAFQEGMVHRTAHTGDRPDLVETWQQDWRAVHAMVTIADDDRERLQKRANECLASVPGGTTIWAEDGAVLYGGPDRDVKIEHFGFREGISNPILVTTGGEGTAGPGRFREEFPLSQVLVRHDRADVEAYGSYLVFRKLEQNVRRFREAELQLGDILEQRGGDKRCAGAFVVGRFRDGTPVISSGVPTGVGVRSVDNGFKFYRDFHDPNLRCPAHAHIRRANPRETTPLGAWSGESVVERSHLIVRRGMTYGTSPVAAESVMSEAELGQLPDSGIGTLFMCVQASIEDQFEFVQRQWINSPATPGGGPDLRDPVASTNGKVKPQEWPSVWGDPRRASFAFPECVRLLGGAYLYLPPIPWLRRP